MTQGLLRSVQRILSELNKFCRKILHLREEAFDAVQTMVDLRPDSSSYARVSYLRSLHGDTEGAIQAMVAAVKAANQEPRAVYRAKRMGFDRLLAGTQLL